MSISLFFVSFLAINELTSIRIDSHVVLLTDDSAKLTTLPLEIREKPANEIIHYVIDHLNAPISLHRTKLMVVGYEKVGKTSLLEHLFPFKTTSPITIMLSGQQQQQVTLEVIGKELRLQVKRTEGEGHIDKKARSTDKFNLSEGKWTIKTDQIINNVELSQEGNQTSHFTFTITDTV